MIITVKSKRGKYRNFGVWDWGLYLAVSFHSISWPSTDRSSSNSVKSCGGAGPSSSSPRMKRILSAAGETVERGKILRFIGWQWCPLGKGLGSDFPSSAGPFQLTSGGGGGGGIFTMTSSSFSSVSSSFSSFSSWLLLLLDIFKNSLTPPLLSKSDSPGFAPQIAVGKPHKLTESQSRTRPSLKSRVEVTVALSCLLEHFVNQVGGGRWGLGVPSVTVSPQLAPSLLCPPPPPQTGPCYWPSSLGKLPWSPSLTIRKWFHKLAYSPTEAWLSSPCLLIWIFREQHKQNFNRADT